VGGMGGGALYLIAGAVLDLQTNTIINASGAGGDIAPSIKGGGGGGSGGFIGIDSPNLQLGGNVRIFALGGGGSTGGDQTVEGQPGHDPTSPTEPAPTATGSCGGNGGGGSSRSQGGLIGGGNNTCSISKPGGGGGGSSGYIAASPQILGSLSSSNDVAPLPLQLP